MGLLSSPTRRAAALAALVAAAVGAAHSGGARLDTASTAPRAAELLAAGTYVGASVWTTFVAGIVLFRAFGGTPVFGDVQAVLFPAYFALQTVTAGATLALAVALAAPRARIAAAGVALAAALANAVVVEPMTTKAMYERRAADAGTDEGVKKAARKRFGQLHGASSLANLIGLGGGVAYVWFVAEAM